MNAFECNVFQFGRNVGHFYWTVIPTCQSFYHFKMFHLQKKSYFDRLVFSSFIFSQCFELLFNLNRGLGNGLYFFIFCLFLFRTFMRDDVVCSLFPFSKMPMLFVRFVFSHFSSNAFFQMLFIF